MIKLFAIFAAIFSFIFSPAFSLAAAVEKEDFILTTEPAVLYAFGGLTRKESVLDILRRLDENKMRATFFVNDRETTRNKDVIDAIAASGQELAVAVANRSGGSYDEIAAQIAAVKKFFNEHYGVEPRLVRCLYGEETDGLKSAVGDAGCRLIGRTVNVVQSRHKAAKTADEVLKELFGPAVRSLGRGQIVYFRTDFYDEPLLAGDLMLAIKKSKIDNIAYRSPDDSPETNPANDSAYYVAAIGDVLAKTDKLWHYVEPDEMPLELRPYHREIKDDAEFKEEFFKRYIGAPEVDETDRMLGLRWKDMVDADKSGLIKTVTDNTVFLTFDDWGHDESVNHLLYVLRKHNVKGTFFIITWNMVNNPNLLRAIAAEGHEIASHTNRHSAMARRLEGQRKQTAAMEDTEYAEDVAASYEKLARMTADVVVDGKHSLTRLFRPPTLAVSRKGLQSILEAGFTYIVSGNVSTHDYEAANVYDIVDGITNGIYYTKKIKNANSIVNIIDAKNFRNRPPVRSGSVIVMHMTHHAKYTPRALDILLTANAKRPDGDPLKFKCGRLSDYLIDGVYDQRKNPVKSAAAAENKNTAAQSLSSSK